MICVTQRLGELQYVGKVFLQLARTLGYEMEVDHIVDGLHYWYTWTHVKLSSRRRRRHSWSASSLNEEDVDCDDNEGTWEEDGGHTACGDGHYTVECESSTPDAR
jgi:hypothetical protein